MGAIIAIIAGTIDGGEDVSELFVSSELFFVLIVFILAFLLGVILILLIKNGLIFVDKALFHFIQPAGEVTSETSLIVIVDLIVGMAEQQLVELSLIHFKFSINII